MYALVKTAVTHFVHPNMFRVLISELQIVRPMHMLFNRTSLQRMKTNVVQKKEIRRTSLGDESPVIQST